MRWITAGESHGPALVAVLEGLPAGVTVGTEAIADELARRRLGYGRGARMKFERDQVSLLGGVRHGLSMGGPVAIQIANTEWPKWREVMGVDAPDEETAAHLADLARNAPLTRPRPGHADLAGMQKYGFDEARPVLERASARETAARVALGAVAQSYLRQVVGAEVVSHVVAIGAADAVDGPLPCPADRETIDASPTRALHPDSTAAMVTEIEAAKADGDTLGGVVEVLVYGLPPGLGSYVHGDRRLDARLAGALMGIQAMKGVEVGDGFATARRRGSAAHDEMDPRGPGVTRRSNRAGGIEGGMTNGEILRVRVAMKPISTVPRALATIDVATGQAAVANHQRSDVCAVPAAGVVAEAMVALVVADAVAEKFGGDSVVEVQRNVGSYLASIADTLPVPGPLPDGHPQQDAARRGDGILHDEDSMAGFEDPQAGPPGPQDPPADPDRPA
ncbi:chorismate synthase [Nakamurella flavida]|uniref:chorismate synthase n=1 Tax=Nakamurella flavida TaxID=363630 RepID=UPI001F05AA42|nr:chorismate synthase [Nakamurella flavida]